MDDVATDDDMVTDDELKKSTHEMNAFLCFLVDFRQQN